MIAGVADTHAALWYLLKNPRLSDRPDRIVAATAVYFGVPVISRDGRIRASNLQTVW